MEKKSWIDKLAQSIEETLGAECRNAVMSGSESLKSSSGPRKKTEWVAEAMQRLSSSCDAETARSIMARCSCPYPQKNLRALKEVYSKEGIQGFVKAIQDVRINRITAALGYDKALLQKAEHEHWYLSPTLEEDTIVITTIPYHIRAYMLAKDKKKKRLHYCHCGWVNSSLGLIPRPFCYCATGFHRQLLEGIFESSLQVLRVDVVQTIMMDGADFCRFSCAIPDTR